jgi:putative Mg2+ transporter-C (MgtC) family protein
MYTDKNPSTYGGTMISEAEIILRVLLGAALGALVGYQREIHHEPAGLRTHTILVLGSALCMTLSINIAQQFRLTALNGDPGRIAAQIVSGIGFLCAGAIIREGFTVRGLATATSLWTMAIVGMTVGLGYYLTALVVTLLILGASSLLNIIEQRYIHPHLTVALTLKAEDRPGLLDEIKKVLAQKGRRILSLGIRRNLEDRNLAIEADIDTTQADPTGSLLDELSAIPGVHSFKIG